MKDAFEDQRHEAAVREAERANARAASREERRRAELEAGQHADRASAAARRAATASNMVADERGKPLARFRQLHRGRTSEDVELAVDRTVRQARARAAAVPAPTEPAAGADLARLVVDYVAGHDAGFAEYLRGLAGEQLSPLGPGQVEERLSAARRHAAEAREASDRARDAAAVAAKARTTIGLTGDPRLLVAGQAAAEQAEAAATQGEQARQRTLDALDTGELL